MLRVSSNQIVCPRWPDSSNKSTVTFKVSCLRDKRLAGTHVFRKVRTASASQVTLFLGRARRHLKSPLKHLLMRCKNPQCPFSRKVWKLHFALYSRNCIVFRPHTAMQGTVKYQLQLAEVDPYPADDSMKPIIWHRCYAFEGPDLHALRRCMLFYQEFLIFGELPEQPACKKPSFV